MLKNKVAVVTGGSRGIGRAISKEMAENGADVAILYAGNEEKANELVAELSKTVKAKAYKCDVKDYAAVEAVFKQITEDFGTVDILVNNAGIIKDKVLMAMSAQDFSDVVNTNLGGAFNTIRQVYTIMARKRSGRIINISSVSGLMGNAGQANYSSAKAGMIGLTKTVAKELAARGITCNAVAPGFVETDMTDKLSDTIKKAAIEQIPMRRMAKPEEIANMVCFLASDKASYITGEVIKVDGGLYI